jgi:hypothetical protein
MSSEGSTSPWIPRFFAIVPFVMGLLILGAFLGFVPTDGGTFFAPPWVIITLAMGLILFSLVLWLPDRTPAFFKSVMFIGVMGAVALVCNWTAFAPGIKYTSTFTIGPIETSGEDQLGGRVAFGIVALVIDGILLLGLADWVRKLLRAFK